MSSILIVVFIVSGMIALKKPVFGVISGSILTVALYFVLNDFETIRFLTTTIFGIAASFAGAYMIGWLFSGFKGGKHNTGPSFWGGGDRGHTGGIILSDEERKNMQKRK